MMLSCCEKNTRWTRIPVISTAIQSVTQYVLDGIILRNQGKITGSHQDLVMLLRQFIATCLLCTGIWTSCSYGQADSDSRPANSFRSELWRMEFHDDEEAKKKTAEENTLPDVDIGVRSSQGKGLSPSSEFTAIRRASGRIPGEAGLSELQNETPFAEWKVEEGALQTPRHSVHVTSEYTLSQAAAGRSQVGQETLSDGPSPLTFLVAVVAAVVMTGAIFSERN